MEKKLYVGNIPYSVTSEDLEKLFSEVGSVVDSKIIKRPDGKSKGFGFIEMSTEEEAKAAIEKFDQYNLQNRTIKVDEAKPQSNFRRTSQDSSSNRYRSNYRDRDTNYSDRRKYTSGESSGRNELNIKLKKLRKDLKDKLSQKDNK